jgi:hypothetical protein
MKQDPTQPNIDMTYGFLDVYADDVISFVMKDPGTCNVKDRLIGYIVSDFDVEVM